MFRPSQDHVLHLKTTCSISTVADPQMLKSATTAGYLVLSAKGDTSLAARSDRNSDTGSVSERVKV